MLLVTSCSKKDCKIHSKIPVSCNLIKKVIRAQVLSYEFGENTVFTEHIWVTASAAKCFMFWWNHVQNTLNRGKMLDLTFEPQFDFFEALVFL